jgi:hypothetical protein
MKRDIILFIVSLSNLIFFCGAACFAQQISSTELINNAREYNGKSVVYVGEAVGDVMVRGDFAWVNINDGENAVGIWMSKELAGKIGFTGSYHVIGDRLEITGIFQRNCIQHGGDMDIHAQGIRRISPGRVVSEGLDTTKRNFVFILLAVLCLVFVFVRRRTGSEGRIS